MVCLSDYCSIFRCDVLKRPKRSLKSLNPLARGSSMTKRKKRVINEQQLGVLRTHCSVKKNFKNIRDSYFNSFSL